MLKKIFYGLTKRVCAKGRYVFDLKDNNRAQKNTDKGSGEEQEFDKEVAGI